VRPLGEQGGQVDDREAKRALRDVVAVRKPQAQRVHHVPPAQHAGRDQVGQAAHAHRKGQQADAEQDQGVEQDLLARVRLAVRHREHRQSGTRIVGGAVQGERPEMRRRPGEDDEKQQHRLDRDFPGRGCPAEYGRHRT
jgi:hypothetical protein